MLIYKILMVLNNIIQRLFEFNFFDTKAKYKKIHNIFSL